MHASHWSSCCFAWIPGGALASRISHFCAGLQRLASGKPDLGSGQCLQRTRPALAVTCGPVASAPKSGYDTACCAWQHAKGSSVARLCPTSRFIDLPSSQIARVTKMLGDEYGTASNIKSRVNRLSVLSAITSAQQRLKLYNKVWSGWGAAWGRGRGAGSKPPVRAQCHHLSTAEPQLILSCMM